MLWKTVGGGISSVPVLRFPRGCPNMSIPEVPISKDSLNLSAEPLSGLDAGVLAKLAGLDPGDSRGLLPRLLTLYLSSLEDLLRQLDAARRPVEPKALGWVAHSLKSSSASMGALRLSALCSATEQALREGRIDGLPALLDALVAEASLVEAAVRQRLGRE